ncbi:10 TM acyl transferase domain found in Cas1p-domain-containing protein [Lentinula boryana]|uniref:10 TM acyl transferase domain found in Cas1p-domain-containing protein n=1 Tax=Lentinula boryana TaxID=40481 RepID=A0ABQ8QV28_9AGAR|nr:10 TM acyl transferase domain found in Cas1p-domain-containing protein [Lentinula boryana]
MLPTKTRYTLNPSFSHLVGVAVILVSLCLGIGRRVVFDWFDPLHCNALISRGSWLDSDKKIWQPDGCMLHQYNPETAGKCLGGRQTIFIGDSVTRRLFYQFAHLLDPSLPTAPKEDGLKHANHSLHATSGALVSFFWDPFLNSSHTFDIVSKGIASQNQSTYGSKQPALLTLGGGLWNLRYSDLSGGLPAWEANIESLAQSLPSKGSSDNIVFLPVEEIIPSKLSPDRAKTMHSSDIDAMNSDLYHRIYSSHTVVNSKTNLPIALPLVFNGMLDPSYTQDGIHFADSLVRTQANILLNLHCNEKLPSHFPMDATCCRSYPSPRLLQLTSIMVLVVVGVYQLWASRPEDRSFTSWCSAIESSPLFVMGVAILLIFLADRTGLWLKEQKLFSAWTFGFLCLVSLGAGVLTLKTSDKDLGFLNREQTDEWKGWMQVAILIYHYLGASKVSGIYNPIRVLVAAYLFMSGYGHATFYLKKADFGFLRVAQVLVRLNLLTVILAYTMNTDYLSYYFAPLVSLWYMIMYVTLAAGSRFNDRTPLLVGKILISAALVTLFFHTLWPLETLFEILARIFRIQWSAKEWAFRVKLDLWIVYVGIFAALAVIKIQELHLTESARWPMVQKAAIVLSALIMTWFFVFEVTQESKFTYNYWHPYISCLPVLAFVVLRNANATLRAANSQLFAFIGRCSLETFIIQYHLWLAADTKGVLLVLPGTQWRPLNFIITSIMFVYISNQVAHATGTLVTTVCGQKPKATALPTTSSEAHSSQNSVQPRRWVDRLADGAASPHQASFYKLWEKPVETNYVTKLAVICGAMWMLNLLWSTS